MVLFLIVKLLPNTFLVSDVSFQDLVYDAVVSMRRLNGT